MKQEENPIAAAIILTTHVDSLPVDLYRYDIPTPAEYEPTWCGRCKKFHHPDPLTYNKAVHSLSAQLADSVDEQILEELLNEQCK